MAYQGELDGLCGPYAIVNALAFCGLVECEDRIFETACLRMGSKRWPSLLWEGTTFADLQRMTRACLDNELNSIGVSVSYPFSRLVPASNKDYWKRFDEIFDDESVWCAIIGMMKPSAHWIVAYRDGQRIAFVDSTPMKSDVRKNRSSIHAGSRPTKATQWLIERDEFAAFHIR